MFIVGHRELFYRYITNIHEEISAVAWRPSYSLKDYVSVHVYTTICACGAMKILEGKCEPFIVFMHASNMHPAQNSANEDETTTLS